MITVIMTTVNLFLVAWICVFVIDCSGIIDEIEKAMKKIHPFFHVPKPFSCSLCMTWWLSLIYLLAIGRFSFPYVAITALFAILTSQIRSIIQHIQGSIERAIIRAENRDEYRTAAPREKHQQDERRKIGY